MIKFIKNGGVDTSDATAVANDIKKGKTAYIADGKVTGTLEIDFENKLNVFLQEEEPETKEGIWLQSGDLTYDDIIIGNKMTIYEEWDKITEYEPLPYDFYDSILTSVGTDIHILSGLGTRDTNHYKYDTLTNTYTKLADIPYSIDTGVGTSVGSNIYLFGGRTSRKTAYKYDTLTDEYNQLSDIPGEIYGSKVIAIGTDIYLFDVRIDGIGYCYKYDTLTDTYEQKHAIPVKMWFRPGIASIGTDIYLFGGYDSSSLIRTCYKYDILTDTFESIFTLPKATDDVSAIAMGNNIYLFYEDLCYKYNTLTNTSEQLMNSPVKRDNNYGDTVLINNEIYMINRQTVNVMNLTLDTYPNNSLIISQGHGGYSTQIVNNLGINERLLYEFYDAWHYTTENGFNKTIPTYYGDGEKWVKFKN